MNFRVLYCNHQTADVALRERLAFPNAECLARAYDQWRLRYPESELVVLSTCNRVELYSARPDEEPSPAASEMVKFLSEFHSLSPDAFADRMLQHDGPEAVRHLFQVACSLDSMVLGEPQIVAQVKEAYEQAYRNEACGPLTNALFQMAFRVSGRVRTETALSEGRVSIASVAVGEFGRSIFDRFDDKTVLVIGAGAMAEETLRYLADSGVTDFQIINRNPERAQRLADAWGGRIRLFEDLSAAIADADVVVSATGATHHIMTLDRYRQIRKGSSKRPKFILDLGTPRDFDPAIAGSDENTFLYDVDDLQKTCDLNRRARQKEIERARKIIDQETEKFVHEIYHRATGPVIQRLRDEWHAIRQQEVDMLFARLPHLPEKDREAVERCVERIVNKLLHPPLEALRQEAKSGTPHGLMDALKRLFRLQDAET